MRLNIVGIIVLVVIIAGAVAISTDPREGPIEETAENLEEAAEELIENVEDVADEPEN